MNMPILTEKDHEQNILELYKILGTAKSVADALDISILDVYVILKKYKLSIEERMQMAASSTSILGALGEDQFKKIVPFSVEVNAVINANPAFDFLVGEATVDVKASNLIQRKRGGEKPVGEWLWRLQRHFQSQYGADFYVLFGLYEKDTFDGEYDCYVIPSELLAGIKAVRIRNHLKASSPWRDFLIKPEKMREFFQKIKDSQTPKKQVFDETFLEKENRDFYQIEITELDRLAKKVKKELNHAE